ncbi:hypothetical protein D3C75_719410 [compost metagenome]
MIKNNLTLYFSSHKLTGILFILHIDVLVKHFKHAFSGSFGLRIVVDMEAKAPYRADNIPD